RRSWRRNMPPYSKVVMDHFFNPRNAFRMADAHVVGRAGDPAKGGPYMVLYLRLAGERIEQASYQTYGCGPAIAAGSVLTEGLRGLTSHEAMRWDEEAITAALGGLPVAKRHCSALAADALRVCLDALLDSTPKRTESEGLHGGNR